jgi:hypothetical protein
MVLKDQFHRLGRQIHHRKIFLVKLFEQLESGLIAGRRASAISSNERK